MSVRWRLLYAGAVVGPVADRVQVDRMVAGLRDAWAAGEATTSLVTVQVHVGRGWQDDEVIDFTHEHDDEETA